MSKKHIALVLKFIVSGGLIWWLIDGVDLGAAKERIFNADLDFLGLAVLVSIAQVLICVVRWKVVLTAIEAILSFPSALRIYLIGFFFNQALPSSVGGDGVRMYKAYREGLSLSTSINSVMLERVATTLGLVLLVVIAIPFFVAKIGPADAAWIVPSATVLGIGGVAGLVLLMFLDRMPARISHWRFVRGLALLASDTRRVFLRPIHAAKALGWSLLGHLNVALMVYLLGLSIGLDITWLDCMVLMPPVLLIMALPISIAGWGVREQAMVTAFGLIGVPFEGALVLSIMFGLIGLLFGLPGGVVWMLSRDRKIQAPDDAAE